ncbi:MAG TPA: hypothetical protein VFE65_21495 [Pseudonocardia sp.]|jgi:hypothetical protein|nr:hypothetical protein [Pseudonocardia sp.]
MTVSQWLAENPPPAQGPEFGGSSPIGLVVTLCLLVALIFLIRSMNKHLRKVPKSFDEPEGQADPQSEPGEERSASEPAEGRHATPAVERSASVTDTEVETPPKQ